MELKGQSRKRNLILIGMPASGKSTLGVLAAKALGWDFIDTDVLIQVGERKRLSQLIGEAGASGFRALEDRYVRTLAVDQTVIATGGSAVYSPKAMAHLDRLGAIVWLRVGLAELEARIGDLAARGVLHAPGQTLADLHDERAPLYARYAERTVDCDGQNAEAIVRALVACV